MKAALYARVSTKKQDLASMNYNLIAWADANNYEYFLYTDYAVSGRQDDRKGINQLLLDAEKGLFSVVGVLELSRIGRSISFITQVVKKLGELGVKIVLTNSNMVLDYNTIEGSATVNALAMAADIEWRLISERNTRGRERIKREGIKVGRKHLKISDEAISALLEKGHSYRSIAQELGVSAPTIMRRIKKMEMNKK
jgi:site-specific DNA recombinase